MPKIIHERDKCIGCGACVTVCPKHWQMSNDGKSQLTGSQLNDQTKNFEAEITKVECNQSAADGCPVQCIHIGQ